MSSSDTSPRHQLLRTIPKSPRIDLRTSLNWSREVLYHNAIRAIRAEPSVSDIKNSLLSTEVNDTSQVGASVQIGIALVDLLEPVSPTDQFVQCEVSLSVKIE